MVAVGNTGPFLKPQDKKAFASGIICHLVHVILTNKETFLTIRMLKVINEKEHNGTVVRITPLDPKRNNLITKQKERQH